MIWFCIYHVLKCTNGLFLSREYHSLKRTSISRKWCIERVLLHMLSNGGTKRRHHWQLDLVSELLSHMMPSRIKVLKNINGNSNNKKVIISSRRKGEVKLQHFPFIYLVLIQKRQWHWIYKFLTFIQLSVDEFKFCISWILRKNN